MYAGDSIINEVVVKVPMLRFRIWEQTTNPYYLKV